jgi:N-acetylmuramoyl-L-alanine amidase
MSGNNWSKVPTMLIEMGFMTNPSEDNLMAQSYFQTKMTTGLANGIDKYFGY